MPLSHRWLKLGCPGDKATSFYIYIQQNHPKRTSSGGLAFSVDFAPWVFPQPWHRWLQTKPTDAVELDSRWVRFRVHEVQLDPKVQRPGCIILHQNLLRGCSFDHEKHTNFIGISGINWRESNRVQKGRTIHLTQIWGEVPSLDYLFYGKICGGRTSHSTHPLQEKRFPQSGYSLAAIPWSTGFFIGILK